MGIYYAVANMTKKEFIYDPCDRGIKHSSLFRHDSPMGRLLLFKLLHKGWDEDVISVVSDAYSFPWCTDGYDIDDWKDITHEVIDQYLEYFKDREGTFCEGIYPGYGAPISASISTDPLPLPNNNVESE